MNLNGNGVCDLNVVRTCEDLNPRIVESLLRWIPSVRVHLKKLLDENLGLIWDTFPFSMGEAYIAKCDLFKNLFIIPALERWRPAKKDVKNDSYAPYVTFLVIFLLKHFWSHIKRGTKPLAHLFIPLKEARKAKVYHFNLPLVVKLKKKVLWLKVSVYYTFWMQVVYSKQDLFYNFCSDGFIKGLSFLDNLEYLSTS